MDGDLPLFSQTISDKIGADEGKTLDQYIKENRKVWNLFVRYAMQLINAGRTRGSADAIFQRIRWQSWVEGGEGFKVNNNYRKGFARRLVKERNGLFDEFFEFRGEGGNDGR